MMQKHVAYYELLGVSPTASPAELRKAYRLKALQHHPDRAGNTKEATEAFQNLKAIYEVLADSDRRANYDQFGPSANVHADDDGIDADALSAFFAGRTNPVTEADIVAYEKTYRGGADENEDLTAFFIRFSGDVLLVVDFIPYSDDSDLERFVAFWDEKVTANELEDSDAWRKARKVLLKKGKGKARNLDLATKEVEESDEKDEEENGKEEISPSTPKNAKRKRARKSADDGMAGLAAMIQARRNKGAAQFDKWAAAIEEKEKNSSTKLKNKKSKSRSSPKSSGGEGKSLRPRRHIKKNM